MNKVMKVRKSLASLLALLIGVQLWAQLPRSEDFHVRYSLSEAVVLSRHNLRAPLSSPGSFISRITPYSWYDFGVGAAELTMKGGVLEAINGQFFHKWVVSEGLFEENEAPSDDELHIYANSMQRTITTARYFCAGFVPMKTVTVKHEDLPFHMDPRFDLAFGDDISDREWAVIRDEYDAAYGAEDIRKASEALQPAYDLLSKILDIKNSPAFRDGSFRGFNNHNSSIVCHTGSEAYMTVTINEARQAADALLLQYYFNPDPVAAAFGREMSPEDWRMISNIITVRDEIRFSSPFVQRYVSKGLREYISDALLKEGRKFTFICGHDTNILNVLKSMHVCEYSLPESIEQVTPIGCKLVFEKWTDASGHDFIGVNLVYQTAAQLRECTLLDLNTPPGIVPLKFEGLEANEDGLYPLDMMIQRLQ